MDTKIRAMVFDDDAGIRSVLVYILEGRGYDVWGFARASVCQTCRCPQNHLCADIIICDVSMPGLTGVEFLEHQSMRGCRNKNVALMSAYWSESDRRRTTGLGCQVFQKPFSIAELTNWLDDCEKTIDPNRVLTSWFQENAQAVVLEEDPYQRVAAVVGSLRCSQGNARSMRIL
jgi:CheY-like chemotaxis protein